MRGGSVTINTVQSQYVDGANSRTVVSGQEVPGSHYQTQTGQPAVILYYTEDPAARAAAYSFSIRAIAGTAVPQQAAGYQSTNDEAILIMFEWGSLAPGQSHSAVYRTMLAAGDVTELIEDTAEEAAATAAPTESSEEEDEESPFEVTCTFGGSFRSNEDCPSSRNALNAILTAYHLGEFSGCQRTSMTTTQTTTATSQPPTVSPTPMPTASPTVTPTTSAPTSSPTTAVPTTGVPTATPTTLAPSHFPTAAPAAPTRGPGTRTCYATGDPHYKTFDDMYYDHFGQCDYMLTADCRQNGTQFQVQVRNDNPGRAVVTNVVAVAVRMPNGDVIELTSGGHSIMPAGSNTSSAFALPASGGDGTMYPWVAALSGTRKSVRVPALGVEVLWDGTGGVPRNSVQVLLEPTSVLLNGTCGLCGDADGNATNDNDMVPEHDYWNTNRNSSVSTPTPSPTVGIDISPLFFQPDPLDGDVCVTGPPVVCVCDDPVAPEFCSYLRPGGEYSHCPGYSPAVYDSCVCDFCFDPEEARNIIRIFDDVCRPLVGSLVTLSPTPGPTASPTAPTIAPSTTEPTSLPTTAAPTHEPTRTPTTSEPSSSPTVSTTATSTQTTTPYQGFVECRTYHGWWYLAVSEDQNCAMQIELLDQVAQICNSVSGISYAVRPLVCTPSGFSYFFLQATDATSPLVCNQTVNPLNHAMARFSRFFAGEDRSV